MNTKEKSHPRRQPGTGQAETAAEQAAISTCNFTTASTISQPDGRISALLLRGEEHAVPGSELARMAGVTPRKLRVMVDLERLKRPICASDRGYFLPDDGSKGVLELRKFLRRQDSRCAANRRVTRTARIALRAAETMLLDGQCNLFRGDDG